MVCSIEEACYMTYRKELLQGIKLDYNNLKKELKTSFKNDKFLPPSQIGHRLDKIVEEAKGRNNPTIQSGKAFLGKQNSEAINENDLSKSNKPFKVQIASFNINLTHSIHYYNVM